jgi:hypothetical protein
MRLESGDYLIIVSHDESDQAMEDYAKRWKIEIFQPHYDSRRIVSLVAA